MNKKEIQILIVTFLCFMFLINITTALENLPSAELNQNYIIKQTCASCSYVNASISNSGGFVFNNVEMINNGSSVWTYNFTPTTLGRYDVNGVGDINGVDTSFATYFEVTTTGNESLNSGQSLPLVGGILIMVVCSIGFFILGLKIENNAIKIILIGLASVILFSSVLYSMSIINDTLANYPNFVEGYATFLMIVKTLISMSIFALCIYGGLVALKLWKIKRGFAD